MIVETSFGQRDFSSTALQLAEDYEVSVDTLAEYFADSHGTDDKITITDVQAYLDGINDTGLPETEADSPQADERPLYQMVRRAYPDLPSELTERLATELEPVDFETASPDYLTRIVIRVLEYDAREIHNLARTHGATLMHEADTSLRGLDVSSVYADMPPAFKGKLSRALQEHGLSEARHMAQRGGFRRIHDAFRSAFDLTGNALLDARQKET